MEISLREYQQECVDIIDNLEGGNHLVVVATGLGKTVTFSRIKRKGRVLLLSHRDELVHQPQKYFDCSFGVEQAGERSNGEEVVSASVPSLVRRLDKFDPEDFDMIITDEAHHAAAPSYKKIYKYFKPRIHIGFTATPNRGDNVRLDDVYEDIIFERDLKWGIKNKYLSDINCIQIDIGYDLSKVKKRGGDFEAVALESAVNQERMNRGVAEAYKQYAVGPTVIFATSVKHAHNIAKYIDGAVVVSAETKNRAEIIQKFTNREIPCLVNVMVFTEGTDIPLIETIIIARPTTNASLYTQMVGRGLRIHKDKKFLTLIDCVGVSDKNNICTAPTLYGVDMNVVPAGKRKKAVGMISEIEETVEELCDSPEGWILSAKSIDLFAKDNNLNLNNVNWTRGYDGSMFCSFVNVVNGQSYNDRLFLTPMNELGRTDIYFLRMNCEPYLIQRQVPFQSALDMSRNFLESQGYRSAALWDMKSVKKWGAAPATESQFKKIDSLLRSPRNKKYSEESLADIRAMDMNKYEASIVIGKLLG